MVHQFCFVCLVIFFCYFVLLSVRSCKPCKALNLIILIHCSISWSNSSNPCPHRLWNNSNNSLFCFKNCDCDSISSHHLNAAALTSCTLVWWYTWCFLLTVTHAFCRSLWFDLRIHNISVRNNVWCSTISLVINNSLVENFFWVSYFQWW